MRKAVIASDRRERGNLSPSNRLLRSRSLGSPASAGAPRDDHLKFVSGLAVSVTRQNSRPTLRLLLADPFPKSVVVEITAGSPDNGMNFPPVQLAICEAFRVCI